jgi:hypothetical protein
MRILNILFPFKFCRFCGRYIKKRQYRFVDNVVKPDKKIGCFCWGCRELILSFIRLRNG